MERKIKFILWGSLVVYAVILSVTTINRHYTFRTNALDLGWFMQALWNTSQGVGILYNSIEEFMVCVNTHFGIHFSPILLMLVPVYRIAPYAETLLIIQTVVIGISAYPLFLLGREILKDDKLALALSILYLSNSLIHGINSYDFHATPFAIPFIFLTALYIERKSYTKALLSAFFVLMAKEDAGLALISLGSFYLLRNRGLFSLRTYTSLFNRFFRRYLSLPEDISFVLIILGFFWVILTWKIVIPLIAGMHITSAVYYHNFPCPQYILMKVLYFLIANLTLGFLTFLCPKYTFLLTFVPWLEIMFSCEWNLFRIGFQYPYMIIPLSLISITYSLKELDRDILRTILSVGFIVGIVTSLLTTPALPLENDIKNALLVPADYYQPVTHHHRVLMRITSVLERTNFSILTQNDIFPHLANRINTYVIWGSYCGNSLPKTDIILLDKSLLYSVHSFAVEPYLVNYTKIYEYDGIEVWMKNDVMNFPEARSLLKQLEGIK